MLLSSRISHLKVERFCRYLCEDVLSGAKPNNIDGRASEFRIKCRMEWRKRFLSSILGSTPCPDDTKECDLRNYLGRWYKNVFEEWKQRVLLMFETPMEEHVEDYVIEQCLSGSEPMVYYCSGWLLQRMNTSNLRAIDKRTLKEFVS